MTSLIHQWRLAIVCPMANERETAKSLVAELLNITTGWKQVVFIAVLDSVSQDGTLELLQEQAASEPRLRVIWASESQCVVDVYVRGYREALETGFDWILEIDAGYSHRPAEFVRFMEALGGDVDCVFGSRFCTGGSFQGPVPRYILSKGGTILTNLLLGTRLTDMTSGYQLFRRSALEHVLRQGIQSRGPFFQTEMKFHCRGLQVTEVPITYHTTSSNPSGSKLKDAFRNLIALRKRRFER